MPHLSRTPGERMAVGAVVLLDYHHSGPAGLQPRLLPRLLGHPRPHLHQRGPHQPELAAVPSGELHGPPEGCNPAPSRFARGLEEAPAPGTGTQGYGQPAGTVLSSARLQWRGTLSSAPDTQRSLSGREVSHVQPRLLRQLWLSSSCIDRAARRPAMPCTSSGRRARAAASRRVPDVAST